MSPRKSSSSNKGSKSATRNVLVEQAVTNILTRIDDFLGGEVLTLPQAEYRNAVDALLKKSASVQTSSMLTAFYLLLEPDYSIERFPVGARGEYGDKKLSEGLSIRSITRHNNIKACLENNGSKGGIENFNPLVDKRYRDFMESLKKAPLDQRKLMADYIAQKFAESQRITQPLPPVGADVLTFARARVLFHRLVDTPSEGHIQQFLIAALLREHRKRHSIDVVTHHPHAADEYDGTAGDIEEKINGQLLRAYEVTVRPDWQNRISGFRAKMDKFHLTKYVIIASGINSDPKWAQPASMLATLEPYQRDIAVVDIHDVVNVFTSELTATELRAVVNGVYADLCNPKLSNRDDFKTAYLDVVRGWLDEAGDAQES